MEKYFPPQSDIKGMRIGADEIIAQVIGQVESKHGLYHELKNVQQVIKGRDPQGGLVLDMLPYSLITPETILVPHTALSVLPFELDKEMEEAYVQRTTGLQLAR